MFDVLLADPPWQYLPWGPNGQGRGPERHYRTLSTDEICELTVPATDESVLFLWAVWPRLPDALRVIDAWDFSYRSLAWVWVKLNRNSMGFHMGLGHYTRANSEPCLLATRGHPPKPKARDVQALIVSPVREHSRKPDDQYLKIERLYPQRRYLELFARRKWSQQWRVWGNEVDSDVHLAPGEPNGAR
jgi:N6-adenosine-specific RNA methylase IME4